MPWHVVSQGECLSFIAERHGLKWEDIWEHDNNEALREARRDPNVLLPGDILYLPARRRREHSGATGRRHRMERTGAKVWLSLRLLDAGRRPLVNRAYRLTVAGGEVAGTTNGDGELEVRVPASATEAFLQVDPDPAAGGAPTLWPLSIGHLDPVEYLTGVQARLNALGYESGPVDGIFGPRTKGAVKRFQEDYDLAVDGIPGPITQGKLRDVFGG
jgi:N-acetylmuramoyl-L-alanine amidase